MPFNVYERTGFGKAEIKVNEIKMLRIEKFSKIKRWGSGIGSQHLTVASGSSARRVPVCAVPGQPRQPPPGIVWLGGFTSDMHGMNAEYLGRFAARAVPRRGPAVKVQPRESFGPSSIKAGKGAWFSGR
jgi:hypothetical protein